MRFLVSLFVLASCVPVGAEANTQLNADKEVVLHKNIERTDVNLFLPAKVAVFRAISINPADKSVGPGSTWGETLRSLSAAQMGVMLENVDKRSNRAGVIAKVIEAALKQFAAESHHPELVHVSFLFGGFSKGGGWSATLGQEFGPRTIAFNNVCGWVGEPEKDLSMGGVIIIGGIPDGFKMLDAIPTQYEPARKKGAPWTLALQWDCAHDYANANTLAMPLFAACVRARLPENASPVKGPVKLNALKLEDGWLGDRTTWETNYATIAKYADYRGDKDAASWLPDKYVACVWRSFVSKLPPVQIAAAAKDGGAKLPDFSPKVKRTLIVPQGSAVTLGAAIKAGTKVASLDYYEGDVLLGSVKPDRTEFIWENITAGPRAVYIEYTLADGKKGVSNPALVIVSGEVK